MWTGFLRSLTYLLAISRRSPDEDGEISEDR
jgi:hypothetical protein